jgi:hypothetical protein
MLAWAPQGSCASNLRQGLETHQVGRLDLDVGLGDRKLHALVLANRPSEHVAFLYVWNDLVDEPVTVPDALGRDQRSFRIQAVEDVFEPFALLADQVLGREFPDCRRIVRWSRG